ncbi:MAG: type IX secretion system membrane protein PorP/SprF [Bacteroidales bacterium]
MKRTLFLIFILVTISRFASFAQSGSDSSRITLGYPVYSQYLQNGLIINPAYAGAREELSVAMSVRKQWLGIPDAPELFSFSLHTPLKSDKVALGLSTQFMTYGATTSESVYLMYAYRIKLAKGKLSFGLKAGFDRSSTNYAQLKGIQPNDPVFENNSQPYMLPNIGAGVYYYSNKIYGGFSVPSFLFYRNLGDGKTQLFNSIGEYDFLMSAGGLISFSPEVKFKPSVLVDYSMYSSNHINQLDLNGNLILDDIIWIGGSWRTSEQVAVAIVQIQVNQQLMIGFSYDYPAGRMTTYSKGSGEIFLRYEFGSKVSAANPRYF